MGFRGKIDRFTTAKDLAKQGLYPYFRVIESEQDTEVVVNGERLLMMGSNSYLGLTNHPKVKAAAIRAVEKYGTGCAGSRFLNGTLDIHVELEDKLAAFVEKEAVALYSTGFMVNQGVISTLIGKDDVCIVDRLDHASIIEGARLSAGKHFKFLHNNMEELERTLASNARVGKLVVTDGVFSMDGDIADLPRIVELAENFDSWVMVDDAHGIGVMGPGGKGTVAHYSLTDRVQIIMGTFSKSLASVGGFVASSGDVIDYLKHHSRALIFSASLPPASTATVIAALEIIQKEPERLERLWDCTRRLTAGLKQLGFDTGDTQTPIVPVIVGEDIKAFEACMALMKEGMFVNPAVSPAVQPGRALIRLSVMATHTPQQIDLALGMLEKVGRALRII